MEFLVLGPLEVIGTKGPVRINAGHRTTLLITLLLNACRPVPVPVLASCIWPTDPPVSATENVRTYISELRQMLAAAGDRTQRLTRHPGSYRLDAAPTELDLLRFAALSDAARNAISVNDHVRAATAAGQAITLWRGGPLTGMEVGPVLDAKAASVEERYRRTLCTWIDARFALGDHAELIPLLREKVAEQPLSEYMWVYLATALCRAGRTGDALAVCADARRTFIEQLGIEPGRTLESTQAAILRGDQPGEEAPGGSRPGFRPGRRTGPPPAGARPSFRPAQRGSALASRWQASREVQGPS
jgi:DNA-binding SARP family transcriptional activator